MPQSEESGICRVNSNLDMKTAKSGTADYFWGAHARALRPECLSSDTNTGQIAMFMRREGTAPPGVGGGLPPARNLRSSKGQETGCTCKLQAP